MEIVEIGTFIILAEVHMAIISEMQETYRDVIQP
jgi:3-keto-L-gulonate-6-phosphate decarboxylase